MITAAKCAEVSLSLNRPTQQTPTNTKDEKSTMPHAKVMLRSSPTIKVGKNRYACFSLIRLSLLDVKIQAKISAFKS